MGLFIYITLLATFNESLGIHVILDPIITVFLCNFMSKTYWEGEIWELEPLGQTSVTLEAVTLEYC